MNARIPATKTNLLKTKRTLGLCREGYKLLDEKRKILLMEISSLSSEVEKIQNDVDESLANLYNAVEKCLVEMGKTRFIQASEAVDTEIEIEIEEKKFMGAIIPHISLSIKERIPFFSPFGVSFHMDHAIILMRDALKNIVMLAEKKTALRRLEIEFQRTTKKVNALEKIHIPYYSRLASYISERLDEESREAFATMKEIKKKIISKET